ncbi:cytochrome c oxidase assembly protein [Actinomycetospora endophytica]|uniref:Cytochrome c oxidase assembly protein n=1 Tax=Actinomycetospora endophytica TaxID=2291215 RepID=A0ABS8P1V9_9PSEU|nr:cytochrome c oxidase assembly protein [Actinomycetospora endophytica]MCD2192231.1 cytochrome c oxidase assembly protein [Actinomycetospora endophytica]
MPAVLALATTGVPGAGLPPLTLARAFTAWTARPAVLAGVALLGGGYLAGVRRVRRDGGAWPTRRLVSFLVGVAALVLVGASAIAVYDDTLFWTRALQGVVLLLVAPMLLAGGAPLTLARDTLPTAVVGRLGTVRRSRAARAVSSPGMATIALIAPPFVLYLTGLYPLELRSGVVSGLVAVALLAAGLLYVVSRLQIDPVPRPTHHGLTLGVAIAEMVADGVLGLVLWMGPLLAVSHYAALDRDWGPDQRTDQAIGAGVWWIGGDLAGLPFLGAIAVRFAASDAREARRIDAELDAAEREAAAEQSREDDDGERPRLWWEDDPRFADRFRRS